MLNIFGLVSTDPAGLDAADDPIGEQNDQVILQIAKLNPRSIFVACWGADKNHAERAGVVIRILELEGVTVRCLGTTANGSPRHPSRIAYATELEVYTHAS